MSKTFYKIKKVGEELYSKGGSTPRYGTRWSETGKTWSSLGHVKSHLYVGNYGPGTAEVVECVTTVVRSYPLEELKAQVSQVRAEKRAKREAAHKKWMKQQELKQLQELAAKHGMKVSE